MASSSLLQSIRPQRWTGTGFWLGGTVVLAIVALIASVLASLTSGASPAPDMTLSAPAFTKNEQGASAPSRAIPPGFQKRGTTWVGDMRTPDGMLIRLVLDGRTQTLIGAKIIEPAPVMR